MRQHERGNMKIAVFLRGMGYGGVQIIRLLLAREFAKCGHEVEFVVADASPSHAKPAVPYPLVELRTAALSRTNPIPHIWSASRAFARYLRTAQPDIVLAAVFPCPLVAVLAHRLARARCRLLTSEHGAFSVADKTLPWHAKTLHRQLTALAYRGTDALIAVSKGVAANMTLRTGIAASRIRVIYNPLDMPPPSAPAALAAAEQHWPDSEMPRLLHVGRLTWQKNLPLLLRAVALMQQNAQLLLVGDNPRRGQRQQQQLLALAAELGIGERVIFAGYQDDPMPFYRTADALVMSSRYEGFPGVLLEALACGLPIVSTDCPAGPAEILDNGTFGTLVPLSARQGDAPSDARELACGIHRELATKRDPDMLMARAAEFAPEKSARQYLGLMQQA